LCFHKGNSQGGFGIDKRSLNYSDFSLLALTKTNLTLESQYSKSQQIYSAAQSSYSRLSLESGIIGFGFVPLRIQGYYSTEQQNIYQENYFRLTFDMGLLIEYQKSKIQSQIDQQNKRLVNYKREVEHQKIYIQRSIKSSDSLSATYRNKLKLLITDTIEKTNLHVTRPIYSTQDSLNRVKVIKKESLNAYGDSMKSLIRYSSITDTLNLYRTNSSNTLNELDSIKTLNRNKADSLLNAINKIQSETKKQNVKLRQLSDSITKIENEIKSLMEVARDPKKKISESIGRNITLPKKFQIGRINPFLTETVLNGTPAKGIIIEFGNNTRSTTVTFGKLSSFNEEKLNNLSFSTDYMAFKTSSKIGILSYSTGILFGLKDIIQGSQAFAIPFGNVGIDLKSNLKLTAEFAKSVDYNKVQIETSPDANLNTGYATNLSVLYHPNNKSKLMLSFEKSSQTYNTVGNPYFIAGPSRIKLDYTTNFLKEKLTTEIGIRENIINKESGKFHIQTLNARLKTNFKKYPNLLITYLPIQNQSNFKNLENQSYLIQTNILSLIITNKIKVKSGLIIQNIGFWTQSQDGLVPNFKSKNLIYNLVHINSKNNRISIAYNFGTGHLQKDSLNQSSFRICTEIKLTSTGSFTSNLVAIKPTKYYGQQTGLLGMKLTYKYGLVWFESGIQRILYKKWDYIGRLTLSITI
jgi:hypothetical protein